MGDATGPGRDIAIEPAISVFAEGGGIPRPDHQPTIPRTGATRDCCRAAPSIAVPSAPKGRRKNGAAYTPTASRQNLFLEQSFADEVEIVRSQVRRRRAPPTPHIREVTVTLAG